MGFYKNLHTQGVLSGSLGKVSKTQVFVTGVKELDAVLKELPMRLQKKALRPALRSSAKIVQAEIKRTAPRDSGRLVKSVKVRSMKRSRVRVGVGISAGADYPEGGTLPYYAKWVEFGVAALGTSDRKHKSGKSTGRIAPRPFMRTAIKTREGQVIREFRDKLEVELMRVIAKATGGK